MLCGRELSGIKSCKAEIGNKKKENEILCKFLCLESYIIEKYNKGKPVLILLTEKNNSIPSVPGDENSPVGRLAA